MSTRGLSCAFVIDVSKSGFGWSTWRSAEGGLRRLGPSYGCKVRHRERRGIEDPQTRVFALPEFAWWRKAIFERWNEGCDRLRNLVARDHSPVEGAPDCRT